MIDRLPTALRMASHGGPKQVTDDAVDMVHNEASLLLDYCSRMGLVLTIEQVPLQPLAMGNYLSRVSVRAARSKA